MTYPPLFRRVAALIMIMALLTVEARAHCDTMDGPVVRAARQALTTGDPWHALVWVPPDREAEILSAFDRVLSVRTLGENAKLLAERYFFETLVRVHREGEGAPYTGLKDGEERPEPGIAAAERSLEEKAVESLSGELSGALRQSLERAYREVQDARDYNPAEVDAGRRSVEAYINYIHLVQRLYDAVHPEGSGHGHPVQPHVD
jgi:hypothetical protein